MFQRLLASLRSRERDDDRVRRILNGLRARQWNIAFAESCTGGQLVADLTNGVPGASDVVAGSAVCYQIEAKRRVLGLTSVDEFNVVSAQTAQDMAEAARKLFGAHVGVGTTGWLDGSYRAFWAIQLPLVEGPTVDPIVTTLQSMLPFDPDAGGRVVNRRLLVNEILDKLDAVLKFD